MHQDLKHWFCLGKIYKNIWSKKVPGAEIFDYGISFRGLVNIEIDNILWENMVFYKAFNVQSVQWITNVFQIMVGHAIVTVGRSAVHVENHFDVSFD